jgi:hypothetical protein
MKILYFLLPVRNSVHRYKRRWDQMECTPDILHASATKDGVVSTFPSVLPISDMHTSGSFKSHPDGFPDLSGLFQKME